MEVLIFGGTRYFGRLAAQRLLHLGHKVTLFTRGQTRPPFWDDIEHIAGDRTDADGLVERLRGRRFDGVIDNQCFRREEAEAAIRALRGNVGRYVVASTVSIYGEGGHARRHIRGDETYAPLDRFFVDYRGREPLREDDADVSDHPWDYRPNLATYAEGKRHVERVQLESPADWPWVAVRVPATLGPDDPTGRFPFWLARILDGGPLLLPDGGAHALQLGYAPDLAAFLVRLLEAPVAPRQALNYAQPELPRFVHFLEAMAEAAGTGLRACPVPTAVLHAHSGLPWTEGTYAPFAQSWITMSLERARAQVGLGEQTPLHDWLRTTVDWYRAHPEALATQKHADLRPQELAFARRWDEAMAGLGGSSSD